jgi:hypothetical protein
VARAVRRPLVMISDLMAELSTSWSFPELISLIKIFFMMSVNYLKSCLKWPASKEPAMSRRFFP